MPRVSPAAALVPVHHAPTRLAPPGNMDPAAARIFVRLVAACDPRHFVSSDSEMLTAYCEAVAANEEAVAHMRRDGRVVGGRASPWLRVQESSARVMARLSVRLRIGPRSRLDRKQASKSTARRPSIYDLMARDHG